MHRKRKTSITLPKQDALAEITLRRLLAAGGLLILVGLTIWVIAGSFGSGDDIKPAGDSEEGKDIDQAEKESKDVADNSLAIDEAGKMDGRLEGDGNSDLPVAGPIQADDAQPALELMPSVKVLSGSISATLYGAFAEHFADGDKDEKLDAEILAAHFKRLFFFDINFRRDLRPGDRFAVIWEHTDEVSDGIRILAARFASQYHDHIFEAFFFNDPEDDFGRHYDARGVEVQKRLIDSPIRSYMQVTSLLKDRRPRHSGIDFKAPIGTPVYLPYNAVVERLSRKIKRGNGRFIALRYKESGLQALFLHLDSIENSVKVGATLAAGALIARVGNTGRSYAPHLHYQVQRGRGRILDPYKVHRATRRKVSHKAAADFKALLARLSSKLPDFSGDPPPEEDSTRK